MINYRNLKFELKIKVKVARINMELHSYRIRAETLTLKLEKAKKSLRRKDDYMSWWRILQVKIIMKKNHFYDFFRIISSWSEQGSISEFYEASKIFHFCNKPAQIFCSF